MLVLRVSVHVVDSVCISGSTLVPVYRVEIFVSTLVPVYGVDGVHTTGTAEETTSSMVAVEEVVGDDTEGTFIVTLRPPSAIWNTTDCIRQYETKYLN